ncbi:IclR family transcriptional regulator [Rouxiella badensis]|uniref:IclR family transcriptional regulator n=1 Tax=Rouxiella badensis TaxID=1646377 RepID=UPI0013EEF26A|nr:IclR family transcriptional regulator [Rouxiella badensis]QII37252.1 IclR family transcriptional regulator [Rouxiella badensis]
MNTEYSVEEERSGGIQVISRAAAILNALGSHPEGLSLGAIANEVQLPRSTVQRIVAALGEEGIVRTEGAGGVRLGPMLLRLVSTIHTDVVAIASPYLQQLCNETEETVALGRASGRQIANIHYIVAERELRVVPKFGLNLPIYSTSAGRALLSLKSDLEIRQLVGETLEPATENTVKDIDALMQKVAQVRATGISMESGETVLGISTLAIAIDTILGHYSISVLMPTERHAAKLESVQQAVLSCKEALIGEIGKLGIGK